MHTLTRSEAYNQKLTRYFTGIPCKHGHVCERYVSTTGCVNCLHPKFGSNGPSKNAEERRKAVNEGRIRYFTGEPCKRGHISERYTKLGACIQCLRHGWKAKDLGLVKFEVTVGDEHILTFTAIVLAACRERNPLVEETDIKNRTLPKYRWPGCSLHAWNIFPEDRQKLLRIALNFFQVAPPPLTPRVSLPDPAPAFKRKGTELWKEVQMLNELTANKQHDRLE